jgi:hypothetical protein
LTYINPLWIAQVGPQRRKSGLDAIVHPWHVCKNISRTFERFMFFRFPPDARWNPERSVVEFGIGVGEYEGVVRVSRRVFQILLPETGTPERCLEA